MTTTTKNAAPKTTSAAKDAITLLKADHLTVSGLLDEYEKANTNKKRKVIVAELCTELSVHAQIEEEIFYPTVKAALKDKFMVLPPKSVRRRRTRCAAWKERMTRWTKNRLQK